MIVPEHSTEVDSLLGHILTFVPTCLEEGNPSTAIGYNALLCTRQFSFHSGFSLTLPDLMIPSLKKRSFSHTVSTYRPELAN